MSAEEVAADMMCCCANCGKAEVDDVKLKKCACDLVKYCSVECQKNHRQQHKKTCKKRMAEMKDDRLFSQPDESHLGECPICCLPLPLEMEKSRVMACCSKWICLGCTHANLIRIAKEGLENRCLFCREPVLYSQGKAEKDQMKRVEANDPVAMREFGGNCYINGDYNAAFEYWTKAAGLGDVGAHYQLSCLYKEGKGVDRDKKKELYHLEEAAIGGHTYARYNLAAYEGRDGRHDRAVKHFIIDANLGHDEALAAVKDLFAKGLARKEDFEAALRGHQAAVDATKSKQREEAYALQSLGFTM
jgi:TPR repeat protein